MDAILSWGQNIVLDCVFVNVTSNLLPTYKIDQCICKRLHSLIIGWFPVICVDYNHCLSFQPPAAVGSHPVVQCPVVELDSWRTGGTQLDTDRTRSTSQVRKRGGMQRGGSIISRGFAGCLQNNTCRPDSQQRGVRCSRLQNSYGHPEGTHKHCH